MTPDKQSSQAPGASNVFDANATTYSDGIDEALGKYGADHEFFTTHKAWLLGQILKEEGRDPKAMRLLDVGCGVAKIHRHIADDFASIAGADVSESSLEVARKIYPGIEYKGYDGHRLPYDDGAFDLSMAICVFHHVPPQQWPELAGEMLRVLQPGGLCIVIEHNPYNPVTRRIVNTCPLDVDAVLLSARTLKRVFREAGAANVSSRAILSLPPVNNALRRLDRLMGFMPLGAQYYMVARKSGDIRG